MSDKEKPFCAYVPKRDKGNIRKQFSKSTPTEEELKSAEEWKESKGKEIWGDYWNAIKKGYTSTIRGSDKNYLSVRFYEKSKTIKSATYWFWCIEYVDFITKKTTTKHFAFRIDHPGEKSKAKVKVKATQHYNEVIKSREAFLLNIE